MKKNLLFFFLFSLFISFTACKNEEPAPPAEEPAAEIKYSFSFPEAELAALKEITEKGVEVKLTPEITKTTTIKDKSTSEKLTGENIPADLLTFSSTDEAVSAVLNKGIISLTIRRNVGEARKLSISVSLKDAETIVLDISQEKAFIETVAIKAGKFMMGSPETEIGRGDNESAPNEQNVEAFHIGKYPITYAQFDIYCEKEGLELPKDGSRRRGEHPVAMITWEEAAAFAEWAGGRLPTEAEWEYACRAGTTTAYHFGEDENELENYAWYKKNGAYKTHPAGEKKANPWGIYDMYGNVAEYCSDFHPDTKQVVTRGGNYYRSQAKECRSASRKLENPSPGTRQTGFRIVFNK